MIRNLFLENWQFMASFIRASMHPSLAKNGLNSFHKESAKVDNDVIWDSDVTESPFDNT